MTDARAWLDQVDARTNAATDGPWEADYNEVSQSWTRPQPWLPIVGTEVSCMAHCYGGSARGVEREADAEFIANARTDLPAATTALRAVLDLHDPIDALLNPGRHERVVKVCTGCGTDDGNWQRWPCPTVTAITAALEDA